MDFQLLLLQQRAIKTWRILKNLPPKIKDGIKNWDLHRLGQKELQLIHDHVDYLAPAERRRWEGFMRARNEFLIHYLVFDDVKTYNRDFHYKRTAEVDRILEDLGPFAPISSKQIFEYLEVNDWIGDIRHPHSNRGELYWCPYDDSIGELMTGLRSSVCMPSNNGQIKLLQDHFKTTPKTKIISSTPRVTFVTNVQEDLHADYIAPGSDEIKPIDCLEDEYDYNPFKSAFTSACSIPRVPYTADSSTDANVWIVEPIESIVKLDDDIEQFDAINQDHVLPLVGKNYQNKVDGNNLDLENEWKSAPNHTEGDSSDASSCLSSVQSFIAPYSTPVSGFPDSPIEFKDATNEIASPVCHEDNIDTKNIPKLKGHTSRDSVVNPLNSITAGIGNVNTAFAKAIVQTHDDSVTCFKTVRLILRNAIQDIRAITDCEDAFAADLISGVIAKAVADITAVNPDNTPTEAVGNFNNAIGELIDIIDDMIASKNI